LAVLTHNVITALKRMALPEKVAFFDLQTPRAASCTTRAAYCAASLASAGEIGCASCPCPPVKLHRDQ
jgi:hypothetical protein